MSRFFNNPTYIVNGDMTAATILGPWIHIEDLDSLGFSGSWAAAATATGTLGVDLSDDVDPVNRSALGPRPMTVTSEMTAQNPAGGASGNISISLSGNNMPRAKWARFKYTRSAAGNANALQLGANGRGA